MTHHLAARFAHDGPKRILALDGGGTRGIVSLCFLEKMEETLRRRLGKPKLVLSDYFDLIGGTSVGSMIATLLAAGETVAAVRDLFEEWAPRIFERDSMGFFDPMFDARVLRGLVQSRILDWPLKSEHIKTGLCIIAKRADTGSVWTLVNNPAGPYFAPRTAGNGPQRLGNGDYRLLDLIRASTAAPRYFSPAGISIFGGVDDYGEPNKGHFVDGGVSPHNNPALQLFMMAGLSGYNLGGGPVNPPGERRPWKLGENNLLIVSVGTGTCDAKAERSKMAALDAVYALQGMISDGQELALTLLQWMSVPRRNWHINRAIGDLRHDLLGDQMGIQQALLSFVRYDVRLEDGWLDDPAHYGPTRKLPIEALRDFTNPHAIPHLKEIAQHCATLQVQRDDFPDAFDGIWDTSVHQS